MPEAYPHKYMNITKVKNDINGNPRRVFHFTELITDQDRNCVCVDLPSYRTTALYDLALKRSRAIGGRKYHNKQYGGGIVIQAYSDDEVRKLVADLLEKINEEQSIQI